MNCGLRRGRWITAALRGRRRSLHNYSTNVLIMEEQRGSSRVFTRSMPVIAKARSLSLKQSHHSTSPAEIRLLDGVLNRSAKNAGFAMTPSLGLDVNYSCESPEGSSTGRRLVGAVSGSTGWGHGAAVPRQPHQPLTPSSPEPGEEGERICMHRRDNHSVISDQRKIPDSCRMCPRRTIFQKSQYNHLYNPVKHGLAQSVDLWPWSSFHRYVEVGYYEPEWGEAVGEDVRKMGCGE